MKHNWQWVQRKTNDKVNYSTVCQKAAVALCILFLTHMLSARLRQFDQFTGSRLRHSHVHPYNNRPFQSHLILMMNCTSVESQKGVTVVTVWPVNHLQSAIFLCSFVDASRLGPSQQGASKHSAEMKNCVEVLLPMFGNFAESDGLAFMWMCSSHQKETQCKRK